MASSLPRLLPRLLPHLRRAGTALARATASSTTRTPSRRPAPERLPGPPPSRRGAYRGDFTGRTTITYEPRLDGDADPGEVVWAWVPYEEDHRQGKDRPVLVIARDGDDLLGLMLTSKDHTPQGRRQGPADHRRFFDLGSGAWDAQGRPSEVRLDRVLRLEPSAVRREGAVVDRARFDRVAAAARDALGW